MDQADTGVHQTRNENITAYEAEPGPYTGPIRVLAWSSISLCWWPLVSSRSTWPCFPDDRDTAWNIKAQLPILAIRQIKTAVAGFVFNRFNSMLYPTHGMVGKGNLVLRYSVSPTHRPIFETLRVDWRNSTSRFVYHINYDNFPN